MNPLTHSGSPHGDAFDRARTPGLGDDYYVIRCETGHRFVIYRPSALGSPTDHDPGKWYYLSAPLQIGVRAGQAFDAPELAERAARRQAEMMA